MSEQKSANVRWHNGEVTQERRAALYGHPGTAVWLTGLSGAGKSTIAYRLEARLAERGCKTYVLDGDNLRHGLNGDLGFSPEDRAENIRRVGEVTKLFVNAGVIVLAAFVSPYRQDRNDIRRNLEEGAFFEVFVDTPLDVCEGRDPKGLYRKARAGLIDSMTGIDAPYEAPLTPELRLMSGERDVDQCAAEMELALARAGRLPPTD